MSDPTPIRMETTLSLENIDTLLTHRAIEIIWHIGKVPLHMTIALGEDVIGDALLQLAVRQIALEKESGIAEVGQGQEQASDQDDEQG